MEAVMGEAGEGNKEEANNSVGETGGARINGEMNGSLEEAMDVCDVTQHDALMLKKLSSDVMSDKSLDDVSSNSLSDNVSSSSSSKEFNKENDSDEETDSEKVPNSEPAIESRDLGTEVPGSDEMDVDEATYKQSIDNEHRESKDSDARSRVSGFESTDEDCLNSDVAVDRHEESMDCDSFSRTDIEREQASIAGLGLDRNDDSVCKTDEEKDLEDCAISQTSLGRHVESPVHADSVGKTELNKDSVTEAVLDSNDESMDEHDNSGSKLVNSEDDDCPSPEVIEDCDDPLGKTDCDVSFSKTDCDDPLGKTDCDVLFSKTDCDDPLGKTNCDVSFSKTDCDDPFGNTVCDGPLGNRDTNDQDDRASPEIVEDCDPLGKSSLGESECDISEINKSADEACSLGKLGNKNELESVHEKCVSDIGLDKDKNNDTMNQDVDEKSNDSVSKSDSAAIKHSTSPQNEEKTDDKDGTEHGDTSSDYKSGESPGKVKKSRKSATQNLTPRRSSRNLNKQKSYIEKEEDPDIQEITPVDPLADPLSTDPLRDDKENTKARSARKNTIVVNDTKRLVEIAAGSKGGKGGKKEPTLVIIDTNSILSGRGPVPVSQGTPSPGPSASSSGYSVLPVALPAQGMYPPMRINTPIVQPPPPPPPPPRPPPPPQILPTLTDDMYVVEAPSFIVPYVYEKPPLKPLKDYIEKLGKEIHEMKEKEAKKRAEAEKVAAEKAQVEKLASEQAEAEKVASEKAEAEKIASEMTEAEKNDTAKSESSQSVENAVENEIENDVVKDKAETNVQMEVEKSSVDENEREEEDSDNKPLEERVKVTQTNSFKASDKVVETENATESSKDKVDGSDVQSKGSSLDDSKEDKDSITDQEKTDKNSATYSLLHKETNSSKDPLDEKDESGEASKSSDKPEDKSASETKSSENVPSSSAPNEEKEKRELKPEEEKVNKPPTYFDNPLGKFFMQIGVNLVQEYVQTDLLRSQKRKRDREGGKGGAVTQFAINSLLKSLEFSKENNEPFHLELKKCEYCSFKTESALVMAQHLETPHMRNYVYRCNFCPLEVRSPHDILFHMEAEHNVRGRLERAPAFHQCPNCPFEDNQKGKLTRHLIACTKKHKPERNQEPPPDWEPPAKIPRIARSRPTALGLGAAAYQAMAGKQAMQHPLLPKLVPGPTMPGSPGTIGRGRGRPPMHNRYLPPEMKAAPQRPIVPTQIRQSMLYRPGGSAGQPPVLLPATYQIAGNQIYQVVGSQGQMMPMMSSSIPSVPRLTLMPPSTASAGSSVPTPVALVPNIAAGNNSITIQSANNKNPAAKLLQQPSISITPLPRQPTGMPGNAMHTKHTGHPGHPGHPAHPGSKATFVICEICDGYIKDLEQLRNHMQWIHKVKIHPKMIYNRPPLNCQKCQFRFFTDQGLERHLLGSHGLVTSSMQEAANKGKDGGRCPVCGRVYQWKLLNHVARDHNMSLKPAHLSYKCTVCTATFGMYKQFENHVYSAHSVVAKRVMDKKPPPAPRPQSSEALLKPLKINDEITIIPQPARPRPGPASRTGAVSAMMQQALGKVYSCERCEATFDGQTGFTQYVSHLRRRHLRRCSVKVCRLEDCPTCRRRHVTQSILDYIEEHKSGVDVIELSDDEVVIAGQGRNEITITKVPCAPGPKRFKQKLQQRHNVQVIELEDSPVKNNKNADINASRENGEDSLNAVKERLRRRKSLEISQVDSECSSPHSSDDTPAKKRRRNDDD